MEDSNETDRILWSVDLLGSEPAAYEGLMDFLTAWVDEVPCRVQPVFVAGAGRDLPDAARAAMIDGLSKTYSSTFARAAQRPKFAPLEILIADGTSLRARVERLLAYAETDKTAAIALTTQARSGLQRWVLGSFTEALILQSRVPLLISNPRHRPSKKPARILFPTDFSDESAGSLRIVVREAKARRLALTILHCAQFNLEHPEAAFGPAEGHAESRTLYLKKRRGQLNDAVREASASGVSAEGILLEDDRDVFDAILGAASQGKADIVAMTSHCDPLVAAFGGSLTRKIVRAADCPVWAVPPESH